MPNLTIASGTISFSTNRMKAPKHASYAPRSMERLARGSEWNAPQSMKTRGSARVIPQVHFVQFTVFGEQFQSKKGR